MKKIYLIIPALIFLLGGTESPINRKIDVKSLTGNISLTLKNAVWRLQENKPIYQSLTLDLTCHKGQCEPQAWGYAPKFNIDVDHIGTVKVIGLDNAWRLEVKMNIQDHPWRSQFDQANYILEVVPRQEKLLGTYRGTLKNATLTGRIVGKVESFTTVAVANHQPLLPQEHPRLIFRKSQLDSLRAKAKTPVGKAILKQINQSLKQPIYYDGYVPTGGYHGAAYCFLSLINEDDQKAQTGWEITEKSMNKPGKRLLEHSAVVAGVALAYDMCYEAWGEAKQKQVTQWLQTETNKLLRGSSAKTRWNNNPWSNWHARARGAAGLAALAILDETYLKNPEPYQAQKAARHIQRYLRTAIGDHGFGIEGDHYTTEPLILTVMPFLQAYRHVLGEDLVENSHAAEIVPHYLQRTITQKGKFFLPSYGRHRRFAGPALFAMGLGIVPKQFLPGALWLFNQNLALKGDQSFGIDLPYQGIFVFANYEPEQKSANPIQVMDKILIDKQQGFFSFRNRWQDEQDVSASIYLRRQSLGGSWAFPDTGSFRIWGLGEEWASPGLPGGHITDENVVMMPKSRPWGTATPTVFLSNSEGSGLVNFKTNISLPPETSKPIKLTWIRSFGVDYSQSSGSPGLFVIADEFKGNIDHPTFADKTWIMHTVGTVSLGKNRFLIRSKNGATLQGTFILPDSVKLRIEKTSAGSKIVASGDNIFWVVMTIQKGTPPEVKVTGTGLGKVVRVGKQEITYQQDRIFWSIF